MRFNKTRFFQLPKTEQWADAPTKSPKNATFFSPDRKYLDIYRPFVYLAICGLRGVLQYTRKFHPDLGGSYKTARRKNTRYVPIIQDLSEKKIWGHCTMCTRSTHLLVPSEFIFTQPLRDFALVPLRFFCCAPCSSLSSYSSTSLNVHWRDESWLLITAPQSSTNPAFLEQNAWILCPFPI